MRGCYFFAKCYEIVHHVARCETRFCSCDAEDLRQSVLEKIHRRKDVFAQVPEQALPAYLRTTVMHTHKDFHRLRASKVLQLPDAAPASMVWSISSPAGQETYVHFKQRYQRLSPKDREIIDASCLNCATDRGIAQGLGLKLNTYHQQVSRARVRFFAK